MSIGLIPINTDLLKILNLKNSFEDSFSTLLSDTYLAAKEIWINLDLKKFPDHSVDFHSINIVRKFIEFNEIFHWNDIEKILFSVASFIHDIGMQYREWVSQDLLEKHPELFVDPTKISDEEIRKKHCELGMNLIKAQIFNDYDIEYPPLFCKEDDESKNILFHSALIGFSHSSNSGEFLEKVSSDFDKSNVLHGQDCRIKLLVCMMILCDELDGTYLRVRNSQKINLASMDDISRKYWLSNIFVEDVCINISSNVTHNKKSAECEIKWRVPLDSKEDEIEKIRSFVNITRLGKLNNEITRIQDYLNRNQDYDSLKSPISGKMATNFSRNVMKVHKKYWRLINTTITGEVATTKVKEIKVIEKVIDKPVDQNSRGFVSTKYSLEVKNDVLSWYHKNMKPGHFVLKSGEHTNVYLNCRSLVSDHELNLKISNYVWRLYKDKKISNVLGVGTSSIPLAVNAAFRLKANVTFTMAKEKVGPIDEDLDAEYTPLEVLPKTNIGDVLLIIDDVISGGNVAKKVIDSIDKNQFPKEIYHFSIFRLGNREINKHEMINDNYSWIEFIPHVNYYLDDSICQMCNDGIAKEYE